MESLRPWPEPTEFMIDRSPELRCAELAYAIMEQFGRDEMTRFGSWVTQTDAIFAGRFAASGIGSAMLLVRQGAHSWTHEGASPGRPIEYESDSGPAHFQSYTLHYGALKPGVMELYGVAGVGESDFDIAPLASIVVEVFDVANSGDEVIAMPVSVSLHDGQTGEILDAEKELHLLGLLEAVYDALQQERFRDDFDAPNTVGDDPGSS